MAAILAAGVPCPDPCYSLLAGAPVPQTCKHTSLAPASGLCTNLLEYSPYRDGSLLTRSLTAISLEGPSLPVLLPPHRI